MKQAEEYLSRAEHAERQARRARDDTERRAFLEIAELWRRMARERVNTIQGGQ